MECVICSGERISGKIFEKRGRQFYRCLTCLAVMQHPLPKLEEISKFYTEEYYDAWGFQKNQEGVLKLKALTFTSWLKEAIPDVPVVSETPAHPRILDVGCALGSLLEVAQAMGFEPWGVELSSFAAGISKKKFGDHRIHNGDLAGADFLSESFSLVTLCDLIEHVDQPKRVLEKCYKILAKNGLLLITTPDTQSFSSRILRRFWPQYLPEHLIYLNRANIAPFLRKQGFEVLQIKSAWKYLTFEYISSWFSKNRIPGLSFVFENGIRIVPRFLKTLPLPFSFGDQLILAKKTTKATLSEVKQVTVIVPAYNEERSIAENIRRIFENSHLDLPLEVIVVESNSKDSTRQLVLELAKKYPIRVILEDRPQGKGHAVRAGLRISTGQVIIIQDADLEYSVEDYRALIKPIVEKRTAFVLGSRVLGAKDWTIRRFNEDLLGSIIFNLGGLWVNWIFNRLYRTHITDQATMYKVFHMDAIQGFEFISNSWDFDVEILAKLVLAGNIPFEVPIRYESRSSKQGKKMKLFDVVIILKAMWRFR